MHVGQSHHDKTQLVVAYPGTDIARTSVLRYVETMRAEFTRVAPVMA